MDTDGEFNTLIFNNLKSNGHLKLQQLKKQKARLSLRQTGFLLNEVSWPISRVLSWTVIHLGLQSLTGSSDLPGSNASHAIRNPIWSCSGWSLPCYELLLAARCALTAPFHPYRPDKSGRRSTLCCTCRRFTPPRRYLAPRSLEPGLSSPFLRTRRLSGQLGADYSLSYPDAPQIIRSWPF